MRYALCAAIVIAALALVSAPRFAVAEDLIVEHNPTDTSHFSSIQSAIDHADSIIKGPSGATKSFRIVVKGDGAAFTGPITPISNVPIVGTETAQTVLTGSGSAPIITIGSGVSNIVIRNLTFQSAAVAVSVSNAANVEIRNNIFRVGTGGTAVQVAGSNTTSIINNTFYLNGTAISTNADPLITNNIFSSNTTAISATGAPQLSQTTYNDFHNNRSNAAPADPHSLPNVLAQNPDPLFVDPAANDFHLQGGSPAHAYAGGAAGNPSYPDAGNGNSFDMGAYGGPTRDTIPTEVSGLTFVVVSPSSVRVSWNVNKSYQVSGYRLYYGGASGVYNGTGATEGASPLFIPQDAGRDTLAATVSGLTAAAAKPPAPVLVGISPQDRALAVSWTRSANATGYKVYFSEAPFDDSSLGSVPFAPVPGGDTTSLLLSGLKNGVTYHVAVAAVSQGEVFLTVTAVNNAVGPFNPGVDNESAFAPELQWAVGAGQQSALSNELSDFPEAVAPFPALKGEGCFIATAAYGFYSAPQVQALRAFRDRYLMDNAPGRAFVAWYYRHGPRGAHFLNAHPWLKIPVRLALFPLVLMAMFLVYTPPLAKVALVVAALVCIDHKLRASRSNDLVDTGEIRW